MVKIHNFYGQNICSVGKYLFPYAFQNKIYSLKLYHLLNITLHSKANACNISTCFRFYRGVSGGWAEWSITHQVFSRIEGVAGRQRGGRGALHYYLPTQFQEANYAPVLYANAGGKKSFCIQNLHMVTSHQSVGLSQKMIQKSKINTIVFSK